MFGWIILLLTFSGVFLLRNFLIPLFADDYSYAFIWDGKDNGNLMDGIGKRERVKSIKDIFISQRSHYLTWSGRFLALGLCQFFILIGKKFFNIANSLIFVYIVFLIYWLGIGKTGFDFISSDLILWILFCYWFCVPSLLFTNLWLCGSCVYLFMAVLQCSFIMPYALNYFNPEFSGSLPMMIILGLLTGLSNEFGGAGVFFMSCFFIINSFIHGNLISWQIFGFLAFCIGYAILIFAPGNSVHVRLIREQFPDYIISKNAYMKKEMFIRNFISGFLPVILRSWILFLPIMFYFAKNGLDINGIYIFAFTLSAIFALIILMLFSPDFPERAGYVSVIFLLIASVSAMQNIIFPDWLKISAFVILFLDCVLCVYADYDFSRQVKKRIKSAEQQKEKDLITVPEIKISKAAFITRDRAINEYLLFGGGFEEYPEGNRNIMFSQYFGYGMKKIVLEREN